MDKVLLQILLIAIISILIGIMDKVKFHFNQSWFSTVTHPEWLRKWLNPHEYIWDKAPGIIAWLLARPLIGLNDFWHFLKFILLQLIFITAWVSYNEMPIFTWLLLCNAVYGVLFEIGYEAILNKKESSVKSLAATQPVMPAFTNWYLYKFRSRIYVFAGCIIVFFAVLLTHFNAPRIITGLVTFAFLGLLLLLGILHTIAWLKLRKAEKEAYGQQ